MTTSPLPHLPTSPSTSTQRYDPERIWPTARGHSHVRLRLKSVKRSSRPSELTGAMRPRSYLVHHSHVRNDGRAAHVAGIVVARIDPTTISGFRMARLRVSHSGAGRTRSPGQQKYRRGQASSQQLPVGARHPHGVGGPPQPRTDECRGLVPHRLDLSLGRLHSAKRRHSTPVRDSEPLTSS